MIDPMSIDCDWVIYERCAITSEFCVAHTLKKCRNIPIAKMISVVGLDKTGLLQTLHVISCDLVRSVMGIKKKTQVARVRPRPMVEMGQLLHLHDGNESSRDQLSLTHWL